MKKIEELIEEALRTEPSFQLKSDFKDRVIKAIRRREKRSQRRLYLWMALGTLVIFGFGYATIAYFMPSVLNTFQTLKGGNQIVPLAVLIGVTVVLIQYLDKRLIKDKMLHM
ncbi:hypothetical protein [Ekhidna sp.]|uniref:hypothetical protein n=1 Tax=Ekhidna sp. TaxID=2608089 RepID=UPI003B50CDC1